MEIKDKTEKDVKSRPETYLEAIKLILNFYANDKMRIKNWHYDKFFDLFVVDVFDPIWYNQTMNLKRSLIQTALPLVMSGVRKWT